MNPPRWLAPLVASGVLVGWLEVTADALHRSSWEGVPRATHVVAAVVLLTAIGVLTAVASALVVAGYQALELRLTRRFGAARWLAPLFGAVLAVASTASTAFWTFSGERIRGTSIGTWGPWALIVLAAGAGAAGALALKALGRILGNGKPRLSFGLAGGWLLVAACVLSRLDLTFYVSLYARLHTLLEFAAGVCAATALLLGLSVGVAKSPRLAKATRFFAAGAGVVALGFVLVEPLRRWVEDSLRHAWREPVYVGRMLSPDADHRRIHP